jgi:CHAD domain-containing protein
VRRFTGVKVTKKKHEKPVEEELRSASLRTACRLLLRPHRHEFFARWKKAKKNLAEDEIHDLRVSSRRLREALALFSPIHDQKQTKSLARKVKKVTRMLGELRNTDEAFRFFSGLTPKEKAQSAAEVEALLTELRRERENSHIHLEKNFAAVKASKLKSALDRIQERQKVSPESAKAFMNIERFAADAIKQRAEPVKELLTLALHEEEAEAQHQLRIAVKKLRYRLEILAPLLKTDYDLLHDGLKNYQDVLGKLHDLDVFMAMGQERSQEGSGKEELLRVMAKRRRRLFRAFLKLQVNLPLHSVGERAVAAL